MRELALHILDIAENSIMAGARHIDLRIDEDLAADRLTITIRDDGRGMDAETVKRVRDPFFTTRTTRHIGLGIPLFAAAAERCAGSLTIESQPGRGTTVRAVFQHSHLDRAPLGNLTDTLLSILLRDQHLDLHYVHTIGGRSFELDTTEIRQVLEDLPLTHPQVWTWLQELILDGESQIKHQTSSPSLDV